MAGAAIAPPQLKPGGRACVSIAGDTNRSFLEDTVTVRSLGERPQLDEFRSSG
jgi:hypothetical protein